MSKLGCYYLHIFYPSHLFLEVPKTFLFTFNERRFSIIIIRNLKSLLINDFNNKIVVDEEATKELNDDTLPKRHKLENSEINIPKGALGIIMEENHIPYMIDDSKSLYKEFYYKDYTEIIVAFETPEAKDNNLIASEALDYFINSYRVVSNDILTLTLEKMPYVSKVYKEYFHAYTTEELSAPSDQRITTNRKVKFGLKTFYMPFWNTQGKKFATSESGNNKDLKIFFDERKVPHAYIEYILRAREELYIHNNYKYSFIESWTTLEISISSILKKIKLERGISKKKIEDYEGQVGISYLLNIELPMIHEPNDEIFKQLIGKVDAIRKIRNKVIHENRDISNDEAVNALTVAIEFLNYFGIKKY